MLRGTSTLDFTSSSYLGFNHSSRSLGHWDSLTLGVPAAMKEPALAKMLAKRLARLQGQESGLLYPSSLHAFVDLVESWPGKNDFQLFYDQHAYMIGKLSIKLAAASGMSTWRFKHHKAEDLGRQISKYLEGKKRPIVLTDGFCPLCGKAAPIRAYLDLIRPFGGYLVLDDTQAMGVLGEDPRPVMPYGYRGGGTLRWLGIKTNNIINISSLAKGFGVPIAFISSNLRFIGNLKLNSILRVHASQSSIADLLCLSNALDCNEKLGERIRRSLFELVYYCKQGLFKDCKTSNSYFPLQHIRLPKRSQLLSLHHLLWEANIHTVLAKHHRHMEPVLMIILRHGIAKDEIDQLQFLINDFMENLKP